MHTWNTQKYKWYFPKLDGGDQKGFNDAGINTFRDKPFMNLAREIIQNSLDAKDKTTLHPVIVKFEETSLPVDIFPDKEIFMETVIRCKDFYCEGDDGEKLKSFKTEAENILLGNFDIKVLKIGDYNTTGLSGSDKESNTNWINLVKSSGASNKNGGTGGSYGIGKHAPYNFSSLRTLFYSTLDGDGNIALQGKAILTTHKDMDGKMRQNIGYFGDPNGCKPIISSLDMPAFFKRDKVGTDLFVIGFKNNEDWEDQVVSAVLEHFFFSIYNGDLVVEVSDSEKKIIINSDRLPALVDEYEAINEEKGEDFNARKYIQVLESSETRSFEMNFKGMGKIELFLLAKKEFTTKKVALIRKTGMKIKDKGNFRVPINFYGVFLATGVDQEDKTIENINDFLRRCEPSSHDNWSGDLYEGDTKRANKLLKELNMWIVDCVKEILPQISDGEVDASGMSQFLPDEYDENTDESEEDAFLNYIPLATTTILEMTKRTSQKHTNIHDNDGAVEIDGEIEIPIQDDRDGENVGNGGEKGGKREKDINIGKKENNDAKKVLAGIPLLKKKTPYNEADGTYHITLIPKDSAENAYIRIRIGGDDDEMKAADIKTAMIDGLRMSVRDGYILGVNFNDGESLKVIVSLNDVGRYLMEVSAYAEK